MVDTNTNPDTIDRDTPVLVTGATGYIGGRLVEKLLERGFRVRAVGRSLDKLGCRPWALHERCELAAGDLHDRDSMIEAAKGCGAAYYLVHSMHRRHTDFAQADREAAYNFVEVAKAANLTRIIYLSGLGEMDKSLSKHLRSRAEVGRILGLGPVPVTVLRAAVILGAGSASFELLRYLVERLPIMITPRWVHTKCQPIAATNVLGYLAGCLETPETTGRSFDIGGPDVLSYEELFQTYARAAGLKKRIIIPVPLLTPKLSSYWIHLITPVPNALARPLIEGLRNEVVCQENTIRELIPQQLLTCREAIDRALERVRQEETETCWFDAGDLRPPEWVHCGDAGYAGGTIFQCGYQMEVEGEPKELWDILTRVGGQTGWYGSDALWRLRGMMDTLIGGPGFRRGRRSHKELRVGDVIDYFRVLQIHEHERLVLLAEMRTPGEAVLEFWTLPAGHGRTRLVLMARFLPRGVLGLLYWYAVYPAHGLVFPRVLSGMARKANLTTISEPRRITDVLSNTCSLPLSREGESTSGQES